jgi:hypothetical protein
LNLSRLREGDFVWSAFPARENRLEPGSLHIVYTLATSVVNSGASYGMIGAITAYTTSQPWQHESKPSGIVVFDRAEASKLGQDRAFVLDLRRLAYLPVTPIWFPYLGQPGDGIVGRAAKPQQRQLMQIAEGLLTRRPEIVERLGPLWPGAPG